MNIPVVERVKIQAQVSTVVLLTLVFAAIPAARASELQDAVDSDNIAQVKALLGSGADPNEHSIYGGPLNLAVSNGSVEIATVLIDAGAKH